MKLVYINDELVSSDGSNSHAVGMLSAFKEILGGDNVISYPEPENGSEKTASVSTDKLKVKLKGVLAFVRCFRKKYISVKKSKVIIADLNGKDFKPTHVLARSTDFDVTAIYVAKKFDAKLIYEVNTPMFYERGVIKKEPMIKSLEKWEEKILKASDRVYVVSNICRDMLCEHYKVSKDKFIVVPNGYMEDLYHGTDEERKVIREKIRKEEGVEDKFVVTFVGSLKAWHGIKTLCETANTMQHDKGVCFMILGDGEMHDMVAEYANSYDNMIFKGKVSLETMKQYLYASDLGIMPYAKQDNFYYSPLKMYDMIGAGLPFIGTAVGQIEEFCESEKIPAFLVAGNDVRSIREKIITFRNQGMDNAIQKVNQLKDKQTWKQRSADLLQNIGKIE